MKHTVEPWEVGELLQQNIIGGVGNEQDVIVSCITTETGDREANAKRIIACVNACAGITNEALEAGVVKGMCEFEHGLHEEWECEDIPITEQTWDGKNIWEDE